MRASSAWAESHFRVFCRQRLHNGEEQEDTSEAARLSEGQTEGRQASYEGNGQCDTDSIQVSVHTATRPPSTDRRERCTDERQPEGGQFHDYMDMRGNKIQLFNYTNGSNVFIKLLIYREKKYNHCDIFFLLVLALILYHTTLNPWKTYN